MVKLLQLVCLVISLSACYSEPASVYYSSHHQLYVDDSPWLPLSEMSPYSDPVGGYDTVVPSDWRRVVESEPSPGQMQVTFESPPSNDIDTFSDYLMIEISAGPTRPGFSQAPSERVAMSFNGSEVYRERFILDQYPIQDITLDLVAWQISLVRDDYTIGLYVVGEKREDARLERILIELAHAFAIRRAPFQLS